MKLTHKLCSAALLAAFGVALAAPEITKAAPEYFGEGKIKFEKRETEDTNTPPGTDGPTITGPVNTDEGDMKIVFVSALDFKTHALEDNQHSNEKRYFADAYKTKTVVKEGEVAEDVTMPNYVKFKDLRTETPTNKYKITAKITKPFTSKVDGDKPALTLNGATINYKNAKLLTANNADTMPGTSEFKPEFTLTEEESEAILTNSSDTLGYGVFDIAFGEIGADEDSTTADKSVELVVPGTTRISDKEYTADITWYIADAN